MRVDVLEACRKKRLSYKVFQISIGVFALILVGIFIYLEMPNWSYTAVMADEGGYLTTENMLFLFLAEIIGFTIIIIGLVINHFILMRDFNALDIQGLSDDEKEHFKKIMKSILLPFIVSVIIFVWDIVDKVVKFDSSFKETAEGIMIILTLMTLFYYGAISLKLEGALSEMKTMYRYRYRKYIVDPVLNSVFVDVNRIDDESIVEKNLVQSGLLSTGYNMFVSNVIEGECNGKKWTNGCVRLFFVETRHYNSHKRCINIYDHEDVMFSGSFMEIESGVDCSNAILIHSKKYKSKEYPFELNKIEPLQTGNILFDSMFEVRSYDLVEALNVLTPKLQETLIHFEEKTVPFTANISYHKITIVLGDEKAGIYGVNYSKLEERTEWQRVESNISNFLESVESLQKWEKVKK